MAVKLVGKIRAEVGPCCQAQGWTWTTPYSVHIIDIKWIHVAVNIEGYAVAPPIMGGIRH